MLEDQWFEITQDGKRNLISEILESSIWKPRRRRKLPTFRDNFKSVKMKLKDQLRTLREE